MQVLGDIPRLGAKRCPHKKAIIMGDKHYTFRQLNDSTNRLAHGLLSLGVSPGDFVAVVAENCLEYVAITYAIAKCGAIMVPINFRYKKDELAYVVNNAEASVLVYGAECISLVEEARNEFTVPVRLLAISGKPLDSDLTLDRLMQGQPTSEPAVSVDPEWPSVVFYTSGTTGFPKGVLVSHSARFRSYEVGIIEGDIDSGDVILISFSMFSAAGLECLLPPAHMLGCTCVILSRGFDPEETLETIDRFGVNLTLFVPTQLAMLVDWSGSHKHNLHNLSTLKKIWYGGSPVPTPTLLEETKKLFNCQFYNFYGQTEAGWLTVLRPEDHAKRPGSIGRAVYNADIRVVDPEGRDTPVGGVGELISAQKPIGMIGYHKMEKATKEKIRDGWLYTGDLVRVEDNGYFTMMDRSQDMIISGAQNIFPKEIEDVIITHPDVAEVAVFGIPDKIWGESICAVVVPKNRTQIDASSIIAYCADRLAGYKKPKHVEFVDELPKGDIGKPLKRVLRDPYWAGLGRQL